MEENTRKVVLLVVAGVCAVAAVVIFLMGRSKSRDFSSFEGQTILLMCDNPDCGHLFEMDKRKYYEYIEANLDPGTLSAPPVKCPQCGAASGRRAVRCEKCEKVFFYGIVEGTYRDTCPKCGYSREEQDRLKPAQR